MGVFILRESKKLI